MCTAGFHAVRMGTGICPSWAPNKKRIEFRSAPKFAVWQVDTVVVRGSNQL